MLTAPLLAGFHLDHGIGHVRVVDLLNVIEIDLIAESFKLGEGLSHPEVSISH